MPDQDDVALDVALQNAQADLAVIKMYLMDNRPLAALQTAVEAEERIDNIDFDRPLDKPDAETVVETTGDL